MLAGVLCKGVHMMKQHMMETIVLYMLQGCLQYIDELKLWIKKMVDCRTHTNGLFGIGMEILVKNGF